MLKLMVNIVVMDLVAFFISALLLVMLVLTVFLVTGITGAPYVPTLSKDLAENLRKLYGFSDNDLLIDLGSGDGKVLATVSKMGAKTIGVELNPFLVLATRIRYRHNKKINVLCRNLFRYRFPAEVTVVYAFAASLYIEPIYRKIQEEADRLNKTIYFISNAFDLEDRKYQKKAGTFYLYKISPKKS